MARQFHERYFPVRPNLEQLKHQAKDLLRGVRQGDADALAEFGKHSRVKIDPAQAKLADAQLALARSYGLPTWARLVMACRMTDAIWRGDVRTVRELVTKNPQLLQEAARGLPDSNWGPPMSYAANVGQDEIIEMLRGMGATDVQHAFDRACLQGKIETARKLHAMGAEAAAICSGWNDARVPRCDADRMGKTVPWPAVSQLGQQGRDGTDCGARRAVSEESTSLVASRESLANVDK